MRYLAGIAYVGFFAVGIVQFFAIAHGFSFAFGVSSFFGYVIALFLAWLPIVGTMAGIYGAVADWGWSWLGATLFFFWPTLLCVFVSVVGAGGTAVLARFQSRG